VADVAAQAAIARRNSDRRYELLERKGVSEEDADAADELANALDARATAARERLAELEGGTRVERLDAQRALVDAQSADLDALDVELERGTLRAPWAGIVSARRLDEGAVVPAGESVVRLVEEGAPEARVGIPAALATSLQRGVEKDVELDGVVHRATVRAVLPEIDPVTRTRTVVLVLGEATVSSVAPGATVRVRVSDEVETRGAWLPRVALVKAPRGLWACYALGAPDERGARRVERRLVEVIHSELDRVLVRGALVEGDAVLAEGAHRVVPNQWVTSEEFGGPGRIESTGTGAQ
jgi:RND family efflux transporter MFP subunit